MSRGRGYDNSQTAFMAISKVNKDIRLRVPRHNAQRINAKLSAEVRNRARAQKVLVDPTQPSSRLTQAIVSLTQLFFFFENKMFLMDIFLFYVLCSSRKAHQIGIRY